jgi:hypothetical protein
VRIRKVYYGWFDARSNQFRISRLPPDAPVRPSVAYDSRSEVVAVIERKRAELLWIPPLTQEQESFCSES